MATPTKDEIEERALELFMARNHDISCNTPELHELKESSIFLEAQHELMRSEENEALNYIEEMANENGYTLVKRKGEDTDYEHVEFYDSIQICESGKFNIPFSIDEQIDSNTLICGANKTGKTRLSCGIASLLENLNWKIIAFDAVGNYKTVSDIPTYCNITKRNYDKEEKVWFYPQPKNSIIFDMSLLRPNKQKLFVDSVLESLWNTQVRKPSKQTLVILEEAQLFMRNIRGAAAQNLLRLATAGRNHKIRLLAITVDLALIDTAFIRLCSQRYYARLNVEENSKRKFKSFHGKDWCRVVQELDLGFFVYMVKEKLQVVKVSLFESKRKPKLYDTKKVLAQ